MRPGLIRPECGLARKCLGMALESKESTTAVLMQLWICGGVVISATVAAAVMEPRWGVHLTAKQGQDMYLAEHMLVASTAGSHPSYNHHE
jgi:hypothetical protein